MLNGIVSSMEEYTLKINNAPREDNMHGSLFVFLKRFVESRYGFSIWIKLVAQAGIPRDVHLMHEMYPAHELDAIVQAASALTGLTRNGARTKCWKIPN